MKFKVGDIVLAYDAVGIITAKYDKSHNDSSRHRLHCDWEVILLTKRNNIPCWQDCFYESELTKYDWKPYPKTFWQKLKLLFQK